MKCFGLSGNPKPKRPTDYSYPSYYNDNHPPAPQTQPPPPQQQMTSHVKHQPLIHIPGCTVHLMDEGQAVELARGDLTILRVSDNGLTLATTVNVGSSSKNNHHNNNGDAIQWPLTKDEPVVKLDDRHYLFTIPMRDGDPLSYGVTFADGRRRGRGRRNVDDDDGGSRLRMMLASLDEFLKENSCFSTSSDIGRETERRRKSGGGGEGEGEIDWKEFAPNIEAYNGVLARAIANGTGQIIRGIFICSNAYANQVQKGGELILNRANEEKKLMHSGVGDRERVQHYYYPSPSQAGGRGGGGAGSAKSNNNNGSLNKNLKRARNLSSMTEKMSKSMLDAIGLASGSVMGPLVRSKTGQAFFSMMPGEVLLASLDAIDKIITAAEAAEKQSVKATSGATVRVVSEKYGESAGVAAGDAIATAGNVIGTAWNVAKIRKAVNPAAAASSASSSGVVRRNQQRGFQRY